MVNKLLITEFKNLRCRYGFFGEKVWKIGVFRKNKWVGV
jgi:hypothetical protein